MRRKIKRKLFLMGMAVSASLPGVVFAKGNGKLEYDAYLRASHWHSVVPSALAEGASVGEDKSPGMFSRLKTIVDRMNYGSEAPVAYTKPSTWRLEMLQPTVAPGEGEAPNAASDKRIGLALRVAF